ncbi:hypothetical protein K488DRAFT_46741, partial [Vararia minispora EC-137]
LSAFDLALQEYISSIPDFKKKRGFIDLCRDAGAGASPDAINELLQKEGEKQTLSGPARRLFRRITNALEDYSEVIGQLASAQPLPLAIIWGSLKVVIQSVARCNFLLDSMKAELDALEIQIRRITDYEHLYSDSKTMQQNVFSSYTNMVRFWHRVHKECNLGSSLTSSSSRKLAAIVSDMKADAESVQKEASILQAKLDKHEYAEAQKDRDAANAERLLQSDWRKKQNAHNYLELSGIIRNFLSSPAQAIAANSQRHEANLQRHHMGTCDWLTEDANYTAWSQAGVSVPSILCLSGPPGYGKSVLTSFAIRDVGRRAAVAHYFCQFSQPCDSASNLFLLLALQLFNVYFSRKLPVDSDLCHQFLSCSSPSQLQKIIRELVINLAPTYFFIDALDEATGPSAPHVQSVLGFLAGLCNEFSGKVRLWCSKRRQRHCIVNCYEAVLQPRAHILLEMSDHTEADVVRFLRARFATLGERFNADADGGLSDGEHAFLVVAENVLLARAKGNFLWAQLMTQNFEGEDRITDVMELLRHLVSDPPAKLADLYSSIFARVRPDDRRIASKVIALVAFARRQLRVEEVREAVLLLTTRGKTNAKDGGLSRISLNSFLSRFTALIEIDAPGPGSATAGSCRLLHSSVLEFLLSRPNVLGADRSLQITSYSIADACLLYLARPIYSKLLQKKAADDDTHVWVDSSGRPMDEHHFTQYAAKYWARHLEDIDDASTFRKRVASLVGSTNFQTCIQVQTLWVQGQFDVYSVAGRPSLLRVLPSWFIQGRSKAWADYRTLHHDWSRILSCGECHDNEPDCPLLEYRGEVDRIWWGALGPDHLFSGFDGRYTSFKLGSRLEDEGPRNGERFEALVVTNERITLLQLRSWDRNAHTLEFVCEQWQCTDSSCVPSLERKQIIRTDEEACGWSMYAHPPAEQSMHLVARPTQFDSEGTLLRIGSQLFLLDDDGTYTLLPRIGAETCVPTYFEEAARRGSFVALGSRANALASTLFARYREVEEFGRDFLLMERLVSLRASFSDAGYDESDSEFDHRSDEDFSDFESSEGEEYESWSEASTEDSEHEGSDEAAEDDAGSQHPSSHLDSDLHSDTSYDSSEDEEDPASDPSEDQPLPATAFLAFEEQDSDDEDVFWGEEVGAQMDDRRDAPQGRRRVDLHLIHDPVEKAKAEPVHAVLTVFFADSGQSPRRIFQHKHPLAFMLYASPPAVHPNMPFIAWPLGAGEILFADVSAKTYFVRKLRLSAARTRHITMKLHFSVCGRFLHIASLEAQIDGAAGDDSNVRRSSTRAPACAAPSAALRLSLVLGTYRLSATKPTRSPPVLVYRTKFSLGDHATLRVSRLPFSFRWTTRALYVVESAPDLRVFRVALFREEGDAAVQVPRHKVFLPDTAREREVRFVPALDGGHAWVIIGSESRVASAALIGNGDAGFEVAAEDATFSGRPSIAPPVGCVLAERDLGGWMRAEDVPVRRGRRVGKLDMRREKFDPVDDCDGERHFQFAVERC